MNTLIALIMTSQLLSCSTISMKEFFSNNRQPAAIEVVNDKEIQELKRLTIQLEKDALVLSEKHNINFSPWMIRDYVARRFINKADWETYLKRIKEKDANLPIDEKEVYKPAPITWDNWLNTSLIIEERTQDEKELTLDEVLNWNLLSVQGTIPASIKLGKLKSFSNYGSNTKERDALSKDEISTINDIDLKFLSPWMKKYSDKNLIKNFSLKWTSLVCEESLPAKLDFLKNNTQCRIIYEQLKLASHFKINNLEVLNDIQKMENGVLENQDALHAWWWYACWPRLSVKKIEELPNQCGMITYLDSGKTKNALGLLIKGINGFLSTPRSPQESFYFALKAQRAFVAIHPLNKGNGRISRWIMDYIAMKSGLPPLLILDHNRDISTPENDYQIQTLRETRKGLDRVSECIKKWNKSSNPLLELEKTECGLVEKN